MNANSFINTARSHRTPQPAKQSKWNDSYARAHKLFSVSCYFSYQMMKMNMTVEYNSEIKIFMEIILRVSKR